MDPRRLRRAWPWSSRTTGTPRRSQAVENPPEHVWRMHRRRTGRARSTCSPRAGVDVPAARSTSAGRAATRGRPRDPHLHLRHHRAPEGLRADPPQPRRRGAHGDRRSCPSCSTARGSTLLFLPLAHVFAQSSSARRVDSRTVARPLAGRQAPARRPRRVPADVLLAVPRVFEKVYNGARAARPPPRQGQDLRRRGGHGHRVQPRRWTPGGPGLGLRLQHALFDPLVYRQLRAALGGRCECGDVRRRPRSASGSATSSAASASPVLEGYGLTETTAGDPGEHPGRAADRHGRPAAARRTRPDRRRRRDPGPRPDRVRAATAQRRGHRGGARPTAGSAPATSASSTTTGSSAITGRKKEIIVTAGGKNVAPAVLEDRLRAHPLVSQVLVVGDGQPFIARARHARPRGAAPVAPPARQARGRRVGGRPRRRPGAARRDRRRHRGGEPGGVAGRADPQVPDPAGRLHRGGRAS